MKIRNKQILFNSAFLLILLTQIYSINIIYEKKNILVKKNDSYIFQVGLEKQNADLIPSYVNIQYDVYNYNGTSCNYFDFFYYVSDADIQCYNYAIGNQSFLFPCPFLSNNYAIIRTNKVSSLNQIPTLEINKIQNLNYTFIVDNTKFPFPTGAYPYTDININIRTTLSIQISSSYQQLALRLIAINVTIFVIFLFIIACLLIKEKRLQIKMKGERKSMQENKNFIPQSRMRNDSQQSNSDEQEHFSEILGKTTVTPSLLQGKDRSMMIDHDHSFG